MTKKVLEQVLQQALEALESIDVEYRSPSGWPLEVSFDEGKCDAAIATLKAALEKPAQELGLFGGQPLLAADRELLELAAKAASIEVWFPRMADGQGGVLEPCHTTVNGETREWNPLTDDGDALRLAVKLRIDVAHTDTQVHALTNEKVQVWEYISIDPCAAARRAITRAAAEIGRNIK